MPIGRYLFHLNKTDDAINVLSKALKNKSLSDESARLGLVSLASIYKKNNDFVLAVPLWKTSASLGDIQSMVELAMYYEHKKSDFQEAIHWTLSARSSSNKTRIFKNQYKKDLDHRLKRLKKKAKNSGKYL